MHFLDETIIFAIKKSYCNRDAIKLAILCY